MSLQVFRYPPLVAVCDAAALNENRVVFVWKDEQLPTYITLNLFNKIAADLSTNAPQWGNVEGVIDALMKKHLDFIAANYPNGLRGTWRVESVEDTGLSYENAKVLMTAFIKLWVDEALPPQCGVGVMDKDMKTTPTKTPKNKDKTKGKKGRRKY